MAYLSPIVLLTVALTIVYFVQTASAAVQYCSSSEAQQDAQIAMKKCNSQIKFCFLRYQDRNPQLLYCKGMLKLLKCAFSENKKFNEKYTDCRSEVLDEWMFVVLQYVCIGKHLGICNDYTDKQIAKMENMTDLYESKARYQGRGVCGMEVSESGSATECAKRIHRQCLRNLVEDTEEEDRALDVKACADEAENLCDGVNNFLSCYSKLVRHPPKICAQPVPEITRKFNDLIQTFSHDLMSKYTENNAMAKDMCCVHEELLDENPMENPCGVRNDDDSD